MEITDETIGLLLGALGDQLQALGSHIELVVIGGSALTALGLVRRATRDVDVLAIADNGELHLAEPLPQPLLTARSAVAADFGLAKNWLNPGPTDLLKWGLPKGFMSRVVTRSYGPALVVHYASRLDQIHFKLFAMVDQSGGRHETDLRALSPTPGELAAAARWSITQDPSPGYRSVLVDALHVLGVDDADLGN
ncbi:MAG TPA: hypothetical protein VFV73_30635 [Streptosporangiaceae bacterium]|nr:hypothetical protein [Streptosporangiaceae bacterium]